MSEEAYFAQYGLEYVQRQIEDMHLFLERGFFFHSSAVIAQKSLPEGALHHICIEDSVVKLGEVDTVELIYRDIRVESYTVADT